MKTQGPHHDIRDAVRALCVEPDPQRCGRACAGVAEEFLNRILASFMNGKLFISVAVNFGRGLVGLGARLFPLISSR